MTDVERKRSHRLLASLVKLNFRKVLIHQHSCFALWPDAYSILEDVSS